MENLSKDNIRKCYKKSIIKPFVEVLLQTFLPIIGHMIKLEIFSTKSCRATLILCLYGFFKDSYK